MEMVLTPEECVQLKESAGWQSAARRCVCYADADECSMVYVGRFAMW